MSRTIESLEQRCLLTGNWTNLNASGSAPANGGAAMMLLSDGTVLVQNGSNPPPSADMFKLSPEAGTGDYVNGVWTDINNMNEARLFFTTAMLQNGNVFAVGGEFPNFSNTAEIFNPTANSGNGSWTYVDSAPTSDSKFGDDPIEVLSTGPNAGQVLAGYYNGTTTYRFNPSAATGSQWTATAGGKLHGEQSDEEAWVKLKDGSILSYDIFASGGGTFQAQRYIPFDPTGTNTDRWIDASNLSPTNPPSILESNGAQGSELGPAFLQPDGNVIYFGANGNTAIYNPTTNIWTAGPQEPQKNLTITRVFDGVNSTTGKNNVHYSVTNGGPATFLVGTDDPGVMLPNGHILIALSPVGPIKAAADGGGYSFPQASYIYEYDPVAQTFTENTPAGLTSTNAFKLNMVQLPNGKVLMSTEGGVFQVYTPDGSPQNTWRPTISSIVDNGGGTFTLKGTQLNGISEGANYGDDNQSSQQLPDY